MLTLINVNYVNSFTILSCIAANVTRQMLSKKKSTKLQVVIVDRFISQLLKIFKSKLPQSVLLSKFFEIYFLHIVLISKFPK